MGKEELVKLDELLSELGKSTKKLSEEIQKANLQQTNTFESTFNTLAINVTKLSTDYKQGQNELRNQLQNVQKVDDDNFNELKKLLSNVLDVQNTSNNLLQTINQRAIETETKIKIIDGIHTQLQDFNHNYTQLLITNNDNYSKLINSIHSLEEIDKLITSKINENYSSLIMAIKDSTESSKEKIQGFSDANQARIQSLLKTLEESPKQISSSFQVSLTILEGSLKNIMTKLIDERIGLLSNEIDKKIGSMQTEIVEMLRAQSNNTNIPTPAMNKGISSMKYTPPSKDLDQIQTLISFFQRSPTEKQECVQRIEHVRDLIISDRTTEAPYGVTASKAFREALTLLQKEDRVVQHNTNRALVKLFEDLHSYILQSLSS